MEKLGHVHMDLSGQFRVESIGCARYILVLVDDTTRKPFVYFNQKLIRSSHCGSVEIILC
eukprot:697822-Rhodomonas_salina.1